MHLNFKIVGPVCMKQSEKTVMKAVALCFKPYLKPSEAMIYCNLERTQFARRCEEHAIYKNNSGYFKKEDLDRMMSGLPSLIEEKSQQIQMKFRRS
jgi:hypothetical protein